MSMMSQDSKKKKIAKEFANLTLELTLVDGARRVIRRRAVGQERRALDLLDVVEASDADKAIREHLGAHLDLSDDLFRVGAAVHRELPHDPVTVVIVAGVDGGVQTRPPVAVSVGVFTIFKLDARSPAVVQQVLNLLGHFGIGERRQEGESLEHPARRGKQNKRRMVSVEIPRFCPRELPCSSRVHNSRSPPCTDRAPSDK